MGDLNKYKDKKVLITGGTGFIGSNIVARLLGLGAKITVLTRRKQKATPKNVKFVKGDQNNQNLLKKIVKNQDIIFNLSGQVDHIKSSSNPLNDIEVNFLNHVKLLEAVLDSNKNTKIVFASTRLVTGPMIDNPVTEKHATNPESIYGINKLAAEKYHLYYFNKFGIRTTILRITNPYGPGQQNDTPLHSIPGFFMSEALKNRELEIHDGGKQLKDYIYIDDLVEIFLRVGLSTKTDGQVYNCGLGQSEQFKTMAELTVSTVGKGTLKYVPRPEIYKREEIGSAIIDISKLKKDIEWYPKTTLSVGIKETYEFYKKNNHKKTNDSK